MHWPAPGLPYGGVEGFVGWAAASIWGGRRRVLSCFVCFWCRGAQCSIYWASPGRRCLRRWALARALAGAGRGSDAGVLRVTQSLGWRALLYFRLQALRICDASQASPRVSERSLSGPTGLEIHVSASVALQKKPACYSTTRTKKTAAITTTPAARPGERCAASPPPALSGDKVCPFVIVFASGCIGQPVS